MPFLRSFLLAFLLFSLIGLEEVLGQCTGCTVTVIGNGVPSQNISSNSVVCLSGNRTDFLDFKNSNNVTLCIAPGGSINSNRFDKLSGLSTINNYGTLTLSGDPNGNWTVNNYNSMTMSISLNSNKTVNNFSILTIFGNIDINGTINLAGLINATGNLQINGGGRISAINALQCNQVNVAGTFRNDGVITGNNQTVPGGLQTGLIVNKLPGGNASPRITGNAIVSTTCPQCATTFSTAGANTFFVPEGVTEINIEMWGGGGRGGNAQGNRRGGGGGGAYSRISIPVTPGETLGVYVGSGGDQTIANGGISYITRDSSIPLPGRITNSILFANGGSSTNSNTGGQGGLGLTAAELASRSGVVSFRGGNGSDSDGNGGGGGSSAGMNALGTTSGNRNGATAPYAGGNGGNGSNANNGNGVLAGLVPGGGGGGGRSNNSNIRNGGNGAPGYVIISYTCPTNDPCSRILDFGTNNGFTIIEYFCSGIWNAPKGLEEFSVTSIGGGGGGGYGSSAGGGGGGAIVTQTFSNINQQPTPLATFGLPANTVFTVFVGEGGNGATGSVGSLNGGESSILGNFSNYANSFVTLSSTSSGGGGGGSSSSIAERRNGKSGGSGGGGAYFGGSYGLGGPAGNLSSDNPGGNSGDNGNNPNRFYGAGGGGAGTSGTTKNGQNQAGSGGIGRQLNNIPALSSISDFFAGGGGGTMIGPGGSPKSNGSSGGGAGNNEGIGDAATINSGSGGGAGSSGGGPGGSGRVYIYYQNFKILPVEYLYFNATYNLQARTGLLSWATAKEWENSHFEIERSVNDVKSWTVIDQVEGADYSDSTVEYSYQDENLPASGGNIFYRLKQVDFSGSFSYSLTRAIQVDKVDGKDSWLAYPNPSALGSEVKFDLLEDTYQDEPIHIQISDIRGILTSYSVSNPEDVSTAVNSYLANSKPGMYIVQLIWGDQSQQIKLFRN